MTRAVQQRREAITPQDVEGELVRSGASGAYSEVGHADDAPATLGLVGRDGSGGAHSSLHTLGVPSALVCRDRLRLASGPYELYMFM